MSDSSSSPPVPAIPDAGVVQIFDTTLRDGEQAPGFSMNRAEKRRMARQLEALGVDALEAGFPAASPEDFASVREIASASGPLCVAALARALEGDIRRAAEALKGAKRPRIHTFLATSDLHLAAKLRMSREDCLSQIRRMVALARSLCPDVEFSAEDASRTDPDFLCRAVETAIAAGANVINIPDTVGYTTPEEFFRLLSDLRERVPPLANAVLSVHCHDDLGLAVANSLAGVRAGARQVECTVCGVGERAGNAALEEIVMGLATRRAHYGNLATNIRTPELVKTARLLSDIVGVKIAPNKAVVGSNAFAHESGIHQHGVMANALTYEIMAPESVGAQDAVLVLGKHSGRHAFATRMAELGFQLSEGRLDQLFKSFKALADRKKGVDDRDLVALAANSPAADETDGWVLDRFVINSGNLMTATACVALRRGEKRVEEVASGTGPIYAAIRAVEKIIRHPFSLEDYQLQAVTEHRDALGEVRVKIADATGLYRGRGVSTDIIEASLLACLSGINAMLRADGQALGRGAAAVAQKSFYGNDLLRGGGGGGAEPPPGK